MIDPALSAEVQAEVAKRRTFAIISHPDAGKTTLTEKLLLYSGMVRTAGMVRARKGGKSASSDWMAMEQERGISITASAMQFPYKDAIINVLDTPGHQDFSEDTYRTLTAADSAIMVIDAAKGVETQTRKLFAVCRMKGIPILTFVNKMDLPGREPLDLMTEVEDALGIQAAPMNWPVGSGKSFVGVVELESREVVLFKRSEQGGALRALVDRKSFAEFRAMPGVDQDVIKVVDDDLELLETAGNKFDYDAFLAGKITPVFFGSALTNFGVEPFFDNFVRLAPPPRPYAAVKKDGAEFEIKPSEHEFSGFVFKIQANMNPKHRDSMAFLRVCSGKFQRDMVVDHPRLGKEIRLSRAYSLVAQDRNTTDDAYPGDVVGVINPGAFAIGDTISLEGGFSFRAMPSFPPEVIAQIRPADVLRHKAFEKGMHQLSLEGAIQILRSYDNPEGPPYVAAVGRLQFDVLQYRLENEYGVKTHLDMLPYRFSSYVEEIDPRTIRRPQSSFLALDARGRVVMLFTGEWEKNFTLERNPGIKLIDFVN
jgi:peptide chain release factor 3